MATSVIKISNNNNILSGSSATLVTSRDMVRNFGATEDYVELHITDPAGKNIYSIVPFLNYKVPGTFSPTDTYSIQELEFDPSQDLKNLGLSSGDYITIYNILRPKIIASNIPSFFIKEISSDRTEIRLITNNITNNELETNTLNFIYEFQGLPYFKEFYLNFGKNQLYPAINIALDKNTNPYSVLIKLLNPLPLQYSVNALINIVDEVSNSQSFRASITPDPIIVTFPTLRGPNFDLDLDNLRVGPTPYYNFNQITNFQGQFAPQLQQLLGQLSASNFSINVDYTDYENFVHYSSAARRLEGFQYKLTNIELYTSASSSAAVSASPTAQLDAVKYQNNINKTIQSFDGYEKYLYYESSSYSWPKYNSTKPYIVQSVTSSASQIWYSGNYDSSSLYDDNNQNYLLYTIPGYIAENTDNELAFKFVASIGQMFDDIWIHIKSITDLYQAKNALTQGISKDLVYFALQSLGVNTYTDQDGNNVFQYLYGVDENGNYLPTTSSYETLVSASNYQLSGQDQQKGIYKRLYSNLPLLLKSKGTTRFNQYLNTIFGIPSTIMGSIEYGGVDKVSSSFEYEFDRFTYALQLSGSNSISIPWTYLSQSAVRTGYDNIVADGIELRFKASPSYSPTQSILYNGTNFSLNVLYTATGSSDSIYSGSTGDFGYFKFSLGNSSVTSSTVPIFTTGSNGETSWYNVLVQRRTPNVRTNNSSSAQTYDVYVKNNVWGEIGHKTSASLSVLNATTNSAWYTQSTLALGNGSYPFSGSIQELRLWSNYVSESAFNFHVLNPESIESNYTSSAFNDLATRFTLGNDLYTYNHNLTSSVSSTHPNQKTQILTASFSNFPNRNNYSSFIETYYANVANSGYANPVIDKIRIISGSTYGTQLLPNKSIELQPIIPITKDIHLLDASLSPQDEIDRDIIAQLGSLYSIDDIIGNPTGTSYDELTVLREQYFQKYNNKYNYKDYIRLIDFFHNSLFRTLKDFTPARTNIATGIVIKPHLLERSNIEINDPEVTQPNNLSQSIDLFAITASSGGNYNQPTYSYTVNTNVGPVNLISDARDFFTGELPSASIFIHDDFDILNFNPYAIGYDLNKVSYFSESVWNINYNPLLNNVEQNQNSTALHKLTLIGGNAGFVSGSVYVTESIQYQDFTNTYNRHIRGRYIGSKTTSQLYNVFSNGDSTFGKTSAIDSNTSKFAFFSEASATGSHLIAMPERTNLYIRYLIDISGSLTELTKRNYPTSGDKRINLCEVQRIFKSGEVVNIGLFDNQNPSKQVSLDGNKRIFQGGFKYEPVLWNVTNRSRIPTLIYELNSNLVNANSSGITLSSPTFQVFTSTPGGSGGGGSYTYTEISIPVTCNASLTLNGNAVITIAINYATIVSSTNVVGNSITLLQGTTSGTLITNVPVEVTSINSTSITNVNSNNPSPSISTIQVSDTPGYLLIHSGSNNLIVSCSLVQSENFGNFNFIAYNNVAASELVYVTESVNYEFDLNIGDIVRFAPLASYVWDPLPSFNDPRFEYIIMDVNKPTSVPNTGANFKHVTFTVDRPIDIENIVTGSGTGTPIPEYIFSRKIPNETNIVIEHIKNPGETSGGIAKNSNLSSVVDNEVANITGELKGKIFSTVLIP